ncbi:MAG: RNA methyltransferase, partial [Eubacteriales bacterium]|nr:RNA methyltransferase [Eubacteriales bacterium]
RQLTGFPMTRGALCVLHRPELPNFAELCRPLRRIAILERVVNPTNIGAIFRSAAALHMDAVLLTPDCCDPLSRRASRVSMGTVFQVPWTYLCTKKENWRQRPMTELKEMGYHFAAMALKDKSIPLDHPSLQDRERLALLLGNEGDGLSEETIASCEDTVIIPMAAGVDSLNVAAASAVAFWQLGNRDKFLNSY